jgi:phosphoribosylaminoimidazolecarboxamide formyltransferase / IMP cyclohydrolase
MIQRALISVSDKSGIAEFAERLAKRGIAIISTGGTYKILEAAGIPVVKIDEVTGFPEMLDGRVKTLHPKIHGGLLGLRDNPDHRAQMASHEIDPIDLVVVNLYPFEQTVAKGAPLEECIEQIDIGGPSMLRSAAKNFRSVTVICDPADYAGVLAEIEETGDTTPETRFELATKVYDTTSKYDHAIQSYLTTASSVADPQPLPSRLQVSLPRSSQLRYGENPHQHAALYGSFLDIFDKVHGKELSYNNIVDIQAAVMLAEEFEEPFAGIIKHTNPCGCAIADSIEDAYKEALSTDPTSAYGGIIVLNRPIGPEFALTLNEMFSEVVIAPGIHPEALPLLMKKKDRRLLLQKKKLRGMMSHEIKTVVNGYLCQTCDVVVEDPSDWKIVTRRAPTDEEMIALTFAWKVVKHVKSNAIVYTNRAKTLGIGAGQMSRVDSSAIAVRKARQANLSLEGSVVASDAYFPFADGLVEAIRSGATAAIEPGGSVRDQEVIDAADEHGIAMLFTGIRHFKH